MRNFQIDFKRYTFNEEDDWGDYDNGKPRKGHFDKLGYCRHNYKCNDGKHHNYLEHVAKWEYFNGKIPEGMEIDHKKPIRNGGTNKLSNLRLVNHKENMNNETTIDNFKKSKEIISDESRKKMSDAKKGKPNLSLSKPVYQYTLDGNFIKEWPSASEAARNITKNGFNNCIVRCCNGGYYSIGRGKWVNINQYKGFKWSYNYE